jgi:hypothetical protein
VTRILDRFGDRLASLGGAELTDAVLAAEGRTIMGEVVAGAPPLLDATSNAELVCAFGVDLVCLNLIDPGAPGALVAGLEDVDPSPDGFNGLARLLGRPVGLNLEPDVRSVPIPFRAGAANARAAQSAGAAFVVVTANPGRGVTLDDLEAAVATVTEAAPGLVCWAGKMHLAGAREPLGPKAVARLVDAGAGGALVPLPGTVPGLSEDTARAMVAEAHERGALAIGTIGTSQEGSEPDTLRALALGAKRIGVDVHHIGDAGFTGVARPESIYAYSVAVRGVRHTWNRMARGPRASWGRAEAVASREGEEQG